MLGAMHKQCATHMPDAMHERTNELTDAETPPTPLRDKAQLNNARDVRRATTGLGDWGSFDWQSLPEGQAGPRRYCRSGSLYVVEFSFGVIKVGQTIAPRERIQRHVKEATRFDGSVSQFWLSASGEDWMSNESRLLVWCFEHGRQTFGEYFADLRFDDAVAYAEALVAR